MASVFDLKTSVNELSSANMGLSRMLYEQHPPTRDVTGDNFPNGAIHTRFTMSGSKWWIPSRSYIRMRFSLSNGANNAPLNSADNIGVNMGLCSNLFQSGEFRIADKTVSRVSDYMAQVDALETRVNKSGAWLDSAGLDSNFWEPDAIDRINKISSDGVDRKINNSFRTVERLQLGYDAATNQVAIADNTGRLTFTQNGGQALPTIGDVWNVGDEIEVDAAGDLGTLRFKITAITGAQELQLGGAKTIAFAAAGVGFRRIRINLESKTRRVRSFENIWQPPMSIFKINHALPAGKYELVLNPQTVNSYKKRAIESLSADKTPSGSGTPPNPINDYDFRVVDMYLYIATVDGPRADDLTYLIDLEETRCQVDTMGNANLQQKNFDVSPSSYALTCAFQDQAAGQDTQYSASKFKVRNDADLQLERLYINYAGQNKPAPDADNKFDSAGNLDYLTQRYIESTLQSGLYFNPGGVESLPDWEKRGPYYYFAWPRDATDRSTRVNVNAGFSGAEATRRVLLFDHYKAVARVEVKNGYVVDVQLEDS